MKKLVALLLMVLFAASVTACAPAKADKVRVKCPACGYEFESPIGGA